jgi:YesN/AraC family two-component response regulator
LKSFNIKLTAGGPGEAIRLVKRHADEIHLLITDVVMPEMNGKDLSNILSKIKPGMKCLYVSGYTADAIAHHGVLEDGVSFIPKPFSMHDLGIKVHNTLVSAV